MKTATASRIAAGLVFAAALGACHTPGVTVSQPDRSRQVSESSHVTRGRITGYRAPVNLENAHVLNTAAFNDFRNQFMLPLQLGPWRYVIDSITLDAESGDDREWTLLIALDTGARVKVENFGAWDDATQSYYRGGYQRAVRALAEARGMDSSLDRYADFWTPKRRRASASAATSAPANQN